MIMTVSGMSDHVTLSQALYDAFHLNDKLLLDQVLGQQRNIVLEHTFLNWTENVFMHNAH